MMLGNVHPARQDDNKRCQRLVRSEEWGNLGHDMHANQEPGTDEPSPLAGRRCLYHFTSKTYEPIHHSSGVDCTMKGLGSLLAAFIASPLCFASHLPALQEPLVSTGKNKLSLTSDLIAFHKNLTQIESISGNEKEVGDWLADSLKSQGYNIEKQYLSKDPERFNVLAWPGKNRDAKVLLSSHIDTVRLPSRHP